MRSPRIFSPPRPPINPANGRRSSTTPVELLDDARAAGIAPRDFAAARLVNLVVKLNDEEPLDPRAEGLRVDLATAAALVYLGRLGYD